MCWHLDNNSPTVAKGRRGTGGCVGMSSGSIFTSLCKNVRETSAFFSYSLAEWDFPMTPNPHFQQSREASVFYYIFK